MPPLPGTWPSVRSSRIRSAACRRGARQAVLHRVFVPSTDDSTCMYIYIYVYIYIHRHICVCEQCNESNAQYPGPGAPVARLFVVGFPCQRFGFLAPEACGGVFVFLFFCFWVFRLVFVASAFELLGLGPQKSMVEFGKVFLLFLLYRLYTYIYIYIGICYPHPVLWCF